MNLAEVANIFLCFPAECNESRFPDPRDFRIAIVEGIPETRLHISFLSPTAQSLTAGIPLETPKVGNFNISRSESDRN